MAEIKQPAERTEVRGVTIHLEPDETGTITAYLAVNGSVRHTRKNVQMQALPNLTMSLLQEGGKLYVAESPTWKNIKTAASGFLGLFRM